MSSTLVVVDVAIGDHFVPSLLARYWLAAFVRCHTVDPPVPVTLFFFTTRPCNVRTRILVEMTELSGLVPTFASNFLARFPVVSPSGYKPAKRVPSSGSISNR